jgi:hypothetical protein
VLLLLLLLQYNGPFNFVGKAVVDHVVAGLLQTAS